MIDNEIKLKLWSRFNDSVTVSFCFIVLFIFTLLGLFILPLIYNKIALVNQIIKSDKKK